MSKQADVEREIPSHCYALASQYIDVLAYHYSLIPPSLPNLAKAIFAACNATLRNSYARGFRISEWNSAKASWHVLTTDQGFPSDFAGESISHICPSVGSAIDAKGVSFAPNPAAALPDAEGKPSNVDSIARTSLLIQVWPLSAHSVANIEDILSLTNNYCLALIKLVQTSSELDADTHYQLKAARALHSADEHNAFNLLKVISALSPKWMFCSFWRSSRSTGSLDKLAELSPTRGDFARTSISDWPAPQRVEKGKTKAEYCVFFPPTILVIPRQAEKSAIVQSFVFATAGTKASIEQLELVDESKLGRALNHCVALFSIDSKNSLSDAERAHYRRRIQLLVAEYHSENGAGPDAILLISAQNGRLQQTGTLRRIFWTPLVPSREAPAKRQMFETVIALGVSDSASSIHSRNLLAAFERCQRQLPLFDILSSVRFMMKRSFEALSVFIQRSATEDPWKEALDSYITTLFSSSSFMAVDCLRRQIVASGGLLADKSIAGALYEFDEDSPINESNALESSNSVVRSIASIVAGNMSHYSAEKGRHVDTPQIGLVVSPRRNGIVIAIARPHFWRLRSTERAALMALIDAIALRAGEPKYDAVPSNFPRISVPPGSSLSERIQFLRQRHGSFAREIAFLAVEVGDSSIRRIRHVHSAIEALHQLPDMLARSVAFAKDSLARMAYDEKTMVVGQLHSGRIECRGTTSVPYHQLIKAIEGDILTAVPVVEPGSGNVVGVIVASSDPQSYDDKKTPGELSELALSISREVSIAQASVLNHFQKDSVEPLFDLASRAHDEPLVSYSELLRNERRASEKLSGEFRTFFSASCEESVCRLLKVGAEALKLKWVELSCIGIPGWHDEAAIPMCHAERGTRYDAKQSSRMRVRCIEHLRKHHRRRLQSKDSKLYYDVVESTVGFTGEPASAVEGSLHYYVFSEGKPLSRSFLLIIFPETEIDFWVAERPLRFFVDHIKAFLRSRLESVAGLDATASILRKRVIEFWLHEIRGKLSAPDTALRRHLDVLRSENYPTSIPGFVTWAIANATVYLQMSETHEGAGTLVELLNSPTEESTATVPDGLALLLYELLIEQIMTLRQCRSPGVPIRLGVFARRLKSEYLCVDIVNSFDAAPETRKLAQLLFNVQIDRDYEREGKGSSGSGLYFCGRMLRSVGVLPRCLESPELDLHNRYKLLPNSFPGMHFQLLIPLSKPKGN